MSISLLKQIKYLAEAFIVYASYFFFKILPIEKSSVIGGGILQFFSSIAKENKVMEKNLKLCLTNSTYNYRKKIILLTWRHFGNIIGELPHWHQMPKKEFLDRVNIVNPQNIPRSKALLVSGHFGNWELISKCANLYDIPLSLVYRPSNNLYVNYLINKLRHYYGIPLIPKGAISVRKILKYLQKNKVVGMLADQKTDDGISVPFFKKNAMTTALPATLALKYNVPIVMVKMLKTGVAKYSIVFYEPLKITANDTKLSIMQKINAALEEWITEYPEQWFWFHNRWK
jgi:KDO2-lipid IV(A) lauroyltransferase